MLDAEAALLAADGLEREAVRHAEVARLAVLLARGELTWPPCSGSAGK